MSDKGHKINLKYVLVNLEGEEIKPNGKKALTAKTVIQECLLADDPKHPSTGDEKVMAGYLAYRKLMEDDPVFDTDELALMKKKCENGCTTAAYYQVKGILDGKVNPMLE